MRKPRRPPGSISTIVVEGDVARVSLDEDTYATIDVADIPRVKGFDWRLDRKGKVSTVIPNPDSPTVRISVTMKTLILGVSGIRGRVIIHLDGNDLNCCRSNLKFITIAELRSMQKKERLEAGISLAPKVQVNRLPKREKASKVPASLGYLGERGREDAANPSHRK